MPQVNELSWTFLGLSFSWFMLMIMIKTSSQSYSLLMNMGSVYYKFNYVFII